MHIRAFFQCFGYCRQEYAESYGKIDHKVSGSLGGERRDQLLRWAARCGQAARQRYLPEASKSRTQDNPLHENSGTFFALQE